MGFAIHLPESFAAGAWYTSAVLMRFACWCVYGLEKNLRTYLAWAAASK